ncbi:YafY family protein [Frankia sp. AiPa1]|uniref:helix-turn-helix transcriptional regulator n=1 Tax=Frankia sp. AiPa1 TaxID=573492 RepID=UPI00202AC89D|nr:WYL domain-containing protein [Frankia sp. AiPa1]MCL9762327.1 WYL domain-containing protein [Frankia sp. AiPa1]
MSAATERLSRLLDLVPWLRAHPGVSSRVAAEAFGITERQLRNDLDLLFVCGLPGGAPGDLIDLSYSGDQITVADPQTLDRPLRLSVDEATALLVAARALADIPGLAGREALDRALEKLERAVGADARAAGQVRVSLEPPGTVPSPTVTSGDGSSSGAWFAENALAGPGPADQAPGDGDAAGGRRPGDAPSAGGRSEVVRSAAVPPGSASVGGSTDLAPPGGSGSDTVLAVLQQALRERRRVHLRYLVWSRDELTERDVDPMRLLVRDGRWYLEGWCHRAEAVRLFRLDRIDGLGGARLLDVPADPPPAAISREVGDGIYRPGPGDVRVVLELAPPARWVADYYPVTATRELAGGGLEVTLFAGETTWLHRLVLGLGADVRVVAPAALAEEVRGLARRALAAYGHATTAGPADRRGGP